MGWTRGLSMYPGRSGTRTGSESPRSWNSAIYRGIVQHRRLAPRPHQFRYCLFMLYLDLDELPGLFDQSRWYSSRSRALAQFRREDHLGDPALPLSYCVRELVQQKTGRRPEGPVRLLTHLRYFGYCFNRFGVVTNQRLRFGWFFWW